jgi:hypothetical protein
MRSLFVRSLQSVLALATVALLTGANDAGCGLGTVVSSGSSGDTTVSAGSGTVPPTEPVMCPPGLELQMICVDPPPPDGGVIPVDECTGPDCPSPPPKCNPGDPGCPPPPAQDAGAPPPPPPCDPADPNCTSPYPGDPPPPPCYPGDPNCAPPSPPFGCSYQCVPATQVCPPGTDAQTVCTESSGSGGGEDGGFGGGSPGDIPPSDPGDPNTPVIIGTCWTECVPHGCGGETPSEPPQPGEPLPD